ncbi:citrate/2-methylcitrate synthase [Pleionea mediterranea]|uniref:Citrate synthase n=1 Tax=Pleionea mediterranea TaxID=523701 RepID=A0A316FPM7_9GAMM|nr:citrate/2-methylcitrate synthase [Pleionea mediterranea]PWK50731.1 citrate synthase [Pleionea mediterranea]
MANKTPANYYSKIWLEEPEEDNPFLSKRQYCYGYDIAEEVLEKASWVEYLYLLFGGEKPSAEQALLLDKLAIVLANPGIRDASVRAAMNAGVGGSTSASSLMSAIAVGSGQFGGAREIHTLVTQWEKFGTNLKQWQAFLLNPNQHQDNIDLWQKYEHPPGFDPYATKHSSFVMSALKKLVSVTPGNALIWLLANYQSLEESCKAGMTLNSVVAAAFYDLNFNAQNSELLFLILRLPGAAAHAMEQQQMGWKKFPFYNDAFTLIDDPGKQGELMDYKDL